MTFPSPKRSSPRLLLLVLLAGGIASFFLAGGYRYLTFDQLVAHKDAVIEWVDAEPLAALAAWVAAYLVLGLFALPGSTVLNLAAGLLFGFRHGLLLAVLGSALASALAFLSFRYLLWDWVEARMRRRFPNLEKVLEQESVFLVLSLRLVPVIPYSATNVILALSPVRFLPYLLFSAVGLLPRHLLYVLAGTHLGDVQSPRDLWSPELVGVLALLAALPWILRWALPRAKALRARPPR